MESVSPWIILLDIIDLAVGAIQLGTQKRMDGVLERFIVIVMLKCMEREMQSRSPLIGARHLIACDSSKPLLTRGLECLGIVDLPRYISETLGEIKREPGAFAEIMSISLACFVVQAFLFRSSSTNLKRKTFHVFAFLVFYKGHRLSFLLSEGFFLILGLLSPCRHVNSLLTPYLSRHDREHSVLSHVYLLLACTYPRMFMRHKEYVSALISICFQDSMASVVGEWFGKTEKSIQGAIGGVVSGIAIYFALYRKVDMVLFFIVAGIVEYLIPINDNIAIPLSAISYSWLSKKIMSSIPSWAVV
ncbi:putative dolichol kinase [Encephalitozoon intestinalis ATCC 50506]|uniref:dolichol kinase n=1 Tax=Encephalitozoon intestinalis (strain ATCC 50506) TaxID=876142 RepID=E0S6L6_ENCIT|nr:putative dolichol kinase [Encephalitozoon intestinalis ATCC 50506]ADM11351.1 putative dolichol kinase [Encephalitozoon intestinalis ATCC 50506]UTX45040.1 membrane protein [Encephalitozoon intestinalis]